MGGYKWGYKWVTVLITHIRGLITPLKTTHKFINLQVLRAGLMWRTCPTISSTLKQRGLKQVHDHLLC